MNVLISAFRWVLAAAVPGGVLVLVILAVKKIAARGTGAAFHYGIWFLLVLRLVIPYAPQSPASALNLIPVLTGLVQKAETSAVHPDQQVQKPLNPALKSADGDASPAQNRPGGKAGAGPASACTPLEAGLAVLWLAGMLFYDSYALWRNRRFLRSLKGSPPAEDDRVRELARQCGLQLHIRADIPVFYSDTVGTPSLYGVLRPKLLIPKRLAGRLEEAELNYVLLHELAHYKRKDIPVLWGTTVLKGFYWFHPLVWYAFYRMRLDCENACDATVLSHLSPESRLGYGYFLLHLLELRLPREPAVHQTAMASGINKIQLKRRIRMISNFQKITFRRAAAAFLLIAAVGVTGLTGAQQVSAKRVEPSSLSAFQQGTVMPATGKDAAEYWADTLAQRDGAARFAILSDDLKKMEYQDYKASNWVIGYSSPWVVSYTVRQEDETDAGTEYRIDYLFSDSTRSKYEGSETITVRQSGENWVVDRHENLENGFPDLSDSKGRFEGIQGAPASAELPIRTAQGTAELWAEALKARNGAYRFACLSSGLQNSEADFFQKQSWVIGTSGVSVTGYSVTPVSQTPDSAQYRIQYQMADSSGKISQSMESITLKKEENTDFWEVTQYEGV